MNVIYDLSRTTRSSPTSNPNTHGRKLTSCPFWSNTMHGSNEGKDKCSHHFICDCLRTTNKLEYVNMQTEYGKMQTTTHVRTFVQGQHRIHCFMH